MKKKRLSFEQFWMKKNNVYAKPYVTELGERIYGLLDGNAPRFVATSHRGDRQFLGANVISTTNNS